MIDRNRIECGELRAKVMSAEEAAGLIQPGTTVGTSGFAGSGYPKAVPQALAARIKKSGKDGMPFRLNLWTGASTGPEIDGALAAVDGVGFRMPFDNHLSCAAPIAATGAMGTLHTAVVEVTAIRGDGGLVPSSSVGNSQSWLDQAKQVILEVNSWQPADLLGMHDIYSVERPPNTRPIPIVKPGDRVGSEILSVDPGKVVAVVETSVPDRNSPVVPATDAVQRIAANVIDFLKHEVRQGRLPAALLPLQLGVGNVAGAVLAGLKTAPFESMTAYTEVVLDGMIDLIDCGKMSAASATALSLSPECARNVNANLRKYRTSIVLRPQDVSNNPEVIRRLGCVAMNPFIEVDIYGRVNSTHVMGSWMMNGIGGAGDFARAALLSIFMTPSVAQSGRISAIVPMCSHLDHGAQDVMVVATEQGVADLRGKSPKQRAETIINNCAHPSYRPLLSDYYKRAKKTSTGLHAPCMLDEAFSWHERFARTGTMMRR